MRQPGVPPLTFTLALSGQRSHHAFGGLLAKLHGSVDTGEIIPPTWNKQMSSPKIRDAWRAAFYLLEHANHVRVIAYSLPQADNYIKYVSGRRLSRTST